MKTLFERIKEYRTKLNFSQEYVANYMEMDRATITQIESGNRKITAEELAQFSRLFGLSADILLNGENNALLMLMFALSFNELDEKDQSEIIRLMQSKKMMKNV